MTWRGPSTSFATPTVAMELQLLDQGRIRRQVATGQWDAVFVDQLMFSPSGGVPIARAFGRRSWIGYDRPEVAARLDAMEDMMDPARRDQLHRELWPFFQADLPVTFLHSGVAWTVAEQRLRGIGRRHVLSPEMVLDELWLEDDR